MKTFKEIRLDESPAKAKKFLQGAKYYDKAWAPEFDRKGSAKGDWAKAWVDLYKTKGGEKIIDKIAKKYKELKVVKIGRPPNDEVQIIASKKAIAELEKQYGANQKKHKDSGWKNRVWAASI